MNKLQQSYKFLNLMRNANKRRYGFEYLAYLRNGATGNPPEYKCSTMAAQAVRLQLLAILGDDPFVEARR